MLGKASTYIPKCRLNNKVAIVTGATSGIGLAIARRLGKEGAKIVICSRNKKNVHNIVQCLQGEGICTIGMGCHVGLAKDRTNLVKETITKFGALDILVSNAGNNTPRMGPIMSCDAKMWDNAFDVNVKASFFLAKECVPHLTKSNDGNIIFLSALAGIHPFKDLGLYSVTKTAVIGMIKALSIDLGSCHKVRVNGIAPGVIQTCFSKNLWGGPETSKQYYDKLVIKRFGKPEDVAGVAAFLASEDATYINGETIVVAGGMPSRL